VRRKKEKQAMEQTNNLDTIKLKKVVEDIFAGGENAVEEFDCSLYTIEELKYIMSEMKKQNINEVKELLEMARECERMEGETDNGTTG
jgi:hypothetical protein